MKVPLNLRHKPIVAINDYDVLDGKFASNSDAKALSIGISQFDNSEITAKVFRNYNNRWSPQSEELPLHRVLDLAIFVISIMNLSKIETQSIFGCERDLLKNKLQIIDSNKYLELLKYYEAHKDIFKTRLDILKKLLN